jgi:hypothetical protein
MEGKNRLDSVESKCIKKGVKAQRHKDVSRKGAKEQRCIGKRHKRLDEVSLD